MPASRFLFFLKYYIKKHLLRKLAPADIFNKRLFRLLALLPGKVRQMGSREVIFDFSIVSDSPVSLYIRNERSSDIQVMHQVYADAEYKPLIDEIHRRNQTNTIKYIIDAGGNVGYVTVFLKTYYRDARVILIEPDENNLAQVKKNLALNSLAHCKIVKGGLWPRDSWLELKKDIDEGKEWSFYVAETSSPTGLRGYSFDAILETAGYDIIDILKIDIEGSEKMLFCDNPGINAVLQKTRFIAIEIHDNTGARSMIYDILKANGFSWFETGELTIATNTMLLPENIRLQQ